MLLRNIYNVQSNTYNDIAVSGNRITSISQQAGQSMNGGPDIHFEDSIVFPGLINSHDHLDFNLYPSLGRGHYSNYAVWGTDIHNIHKELINKILAIPKELRIQWGMYKNLLNGITTVVNHGEKVSAGNGPVNVFQDCNVLHSVRFEQNWKYKLNKPFVRRYPYVMHLGEGRDVSSWEEINSVIKWNFLDRKIIGVHGIAMDTVQARSFKGLVWCPYSNYFLIGKTADIAKLKHNTDILFGTDSTLSASWNLWEHLGIARNEKALSDTELFNSLTAAPAKAWKMKDKGTLVNGQIADIVIAKRKNIENGLDAFFALAPEDILMVIKNGTIQLFDSSLAEQLSRTGIDIGTYSKIVLADSIKYVTGDIGELMKKIRSYYHDVVFPINIAE